MALWDSVARPLGASCLRGRTALITGASGGIGRDVALTFARMGARVAILARRKNLLGDLADEIRQGGGEALVLPADVTQRNQVRESVARALADFGQIDILVNSAGIVLPSAVESLKPRDLHRMLEVNLFGTLHTMQAVVRSMRRAKVGNIVIIASLAGRRGLPPLGGYSATKFALVGLAETLRVELHGSGVRVSLVMPGVVDTPMADNFVAGGGNTSIPGVLPALPVQWVTCAVIAAIVLGLAEVDVPPGAVLLEKMAALFPGLTDATLAFGTRFAQWLGARSQRAQGTGTA
jgi:NAD(P)-dependent dehydrogenase (short-subunit alcohol dehydrogenase family)